MKVYFTVDRRSDGYLQLSIGNDDGGYRIAGPKYDGTSVTLLKHEISKRDIDTIRAFTRKRRTTRKVKNDIS